MSEKIKNVQKQRVPSTQVNKVVKPGPGVGQEEAKKIAEEEKVIAPPQTRAPAKRKLIIETDGADIRIVVQEVTVLELKEICRQLLRNFGG